MNQLQGVSGGSENVGGDPERSEEPGGRVAGAGAGGGGGQPLLRVLACTRAWLGRQLHVFSHVHVHVGFSVSLHCTMCNDDVSMSISNT
jgi:hypothetical protein